jgi:hypothetical protein
LFLSQLQLNSKAAKIGLNEKKKKLQQIANNDNFKLFKTKQTFWDMNIDEIFRLL